MILTDEEKRRIYEEAQELARAETEEGLEQAMELFRSIRGFQDSDRQYIACRTRLGQMRWKAESAMLKEQEDRFEAKVKRWKKIGLVSLAVVYIVPFAAFFHARRMDVDRIAVIGDGIVKIRSAHKVFPRENVSSHDAAGFPYADRGSA